MVDDNPITVSDLPIGVYIVEVTAVNSNDMNNRIVEMITVSDKSTATDESGMYVRMYVCTYLYTCITCTMFVIRNKMLVD